MKIKIFCNLNPNYKHGNQILDTDGICICLTEAMGAGGGQMKPYSVIDTYNQAVYDICPTLKTTYDNNNSIFVVAP